MKFFNYFIGIFKIIFGVFVFWVMGYFLFDPVQRITSDSASLFAYLTVVFYSLILTFGGVDEFRTKKLLPKPVVWIGTIIGMLMLFGVYYFISFFNYTLKSGTLAVAIYIAIITLFDLVRFGIKKKPAIPNETV
jgi:hypothetical protein